ncbi:MAG: carboxypeptidase-like regulatory domain-containing protein, partial [Gammaproteobacteria bacterium]
MIRRFSLCLLFLALSPPMVPAQGDRGSIAGVVTDPSGGVVPGVTIEAVQQATNLKADTVTTTTGVYR